MTITQAFRVSRISRAAGREFYSRQVRLCEEGGSRKGSYGEPHSWGAWNAKAFLILEAMSLDPFKTSHFLWLDIRAPFLGQAQPQASSMWPHRDIIPKAYEIMPSGDRVLISAIRPLRPIGTDYWPTGNKNGGKVDAYMEDIHAICANLYFGSKVAMARLAKAQLALMEHDLARGMISTSPILGQLQALADGGGPYHLDYYVGREESKLS